MGERFEMRVSAEWLGRLDEARGHESRASFVKRAVGRAVDGGVRFSISPELLGEPVPSLDAVALVEGSKVGKASRPVVPASKPFRCPVPKCGFRSTSAAARCGDHGRTVRPA